MQADFRNTTKMTQRQLKQKYKKEFKLCRGTVQQQHNGNACGVHTLYNIICLLFNLDQIDTSTKKIAETNINKLRMWFGNCMLQNQLLLPETTLQQLKEKNEKITKRI